MTWEALVTIGVVALILYGLARNIAPPDVLFLGGVAALMSLSLFTKKLPSPRQFAEAFGNEGLLTVGVLFVVAAGLTEAGGLSLITDRLLGRPKTVRSAVVRLAVPVTAASAFMNNTPVVAMFIPVVGDWCKKSRISPSKLFMPLSYAAIIGGACTLIGTSTNLVVKGMLDQMRDKDPSLPTIGMWTVTPVGLIVAAASLAFLLTIGVKLLPKREVEAIEAGDPREYTIEMLLQPGSTTVGKTVEEAGLRNLPGAYLVEIQRGDQTLVAVGPEERLVAGDRLIFVGVVEAVVDIQKIRGLVPATDQVFKLKDPRRTRCLLEAVVSNTSPVAGKSVREGRFRTRYDAAVIAVHRNGQRITGKIGDIVLRAGDTLLLEAHRRFQAQYRNSQDFLLVSAIEGSEPRRHEKSVTSLLILGVIVVAMATESFTSVSIFNVALIGAGLMIVTRCCSLTQARRSIDWATLVAIGASFGIGRAMETSGAAASIARLIMDPLASVERSGPWLALGGIYLVTLVFTEFATNNAAAALAFPIAFATASQAGVNFLPFAMAVTIAASAGFALPSGYATHLMVNGPGGYRFSDWMRVGIPMDCIVMIVSVVAIPFFFPFR